MLLLAAVQARTDMEAAPVGMKRPTASGSGAASLVPCLMDPRKVHLVVFVHGYQVRRAPKGMHANHDIKTC